MILQSHLNIHIFRHISRTTLHLQSKTHLQNPQSCNSLQPSLLSSLSLAWLPHLPSSKTVKVTPPPIQTTTPSHSNPPPGGVFYATQTYYSASGCTGTADGEATFNTINLCQPLSTILGSVVSVTTNSVTQDPAGCVGK